MLSTHKDPEETLLSLVQEVLRSRAGIGRGVASDLEILDRDGSARAKAELLSLLLSVQILGTEGWAPLAGACDLSALL